MMKLKIERDELIDIFKEITLKEMAKYGPDAALHIAHKALEDFFDTKIDMIFMEKPHDFR